MMPEAVEKMFQECWEVLEERRARGGDVRKSLEEVEREERAAREERFRAACEADPAAASFMHSFFADVAEGASAGCVDVNKTRTEAQLAALGARQNSVWVPLRCENVGCRVRDPGKLRPCRRCGVVFYCGETCRDEDRFAGHGAECEALAALRLVAIPFRSADELRAWPLQGGEPTGSQPRVVDRGRRCFVCGGDGEVEAAPCCGAPVCRTVEGGTYDHPEDDCASFHAHRSLCGLHRSEGHDASADFRTCSQCRERYDAHPWRCPEGVSGACATPLLEISVPQGKRYTAECCMDGCTHRMVPGLEAAVSGPGPDGTLACMRCLFRGGVGNEVDALGFREGEDPDDPLDRDRAFMRMLAAYPGFRAPDRDGGI